MVISCDDKAKKINADKSDCEDNCKADPNGELLVTDVTDNKTCKCPAGKAPVGTGKTAKCVACPTNAVLANDQSKCTCKPTYEPAWSGADGADNSKACSVKIPTGGKINGAKDGFDCKDDYIGANCETPCKWANMSTATKPADGTKAKAVTECKCKAEVWGADCTTTTCAKTDTAINTAKTGCECAKDKVGDPTVGCMTCDTTKGKELSC